MSVFIIRMGFAANSAKVYYQSQRLCGSGRCATRRVSVNLSRTMNWLKGQKKYEKVTTSDAVAFAIGDDDGDGPGDEMSM